MGKNIVLIGFMGTGKSTVGTRLAQKLRLKFIDMDKEIERITGMSVEDIFKKYGEIRFRSEERVLAQRLGKASGQVIATGGGVILDRDNIEALQKNGILILLQASPENILSRVSRKKNTRPLLKKNMKVENIEAMLVKRAEMYNCTEHRINTDNRDVDSIVDDILALVERLGIYKADLERVNPGAETGS